jgi:16S rRNA (cytosine1402-N4)-methyltransferase
MHPTSTEHTEHLPVLLNEVLQYLDPKEEDSYLDLTAGYGGHALEVMALTGRPDKTVLVDRDNNAVEYLQTKFAGKEVKILNQNFFEASKNLLEDNQKFDMILADLGVSSPHLNEAHRGFAINQTGPLDMRMDQSQELTADKIVNTYSEKDLTDILQRYGEEPKALQITKLIRHNRPIHTTTELANIVKKAWPGYSRVHPATRTFQALRIAVNDELGLLERSLPLWLNMLAPGGRLAIISFHSLEDRMVKRVLQDKGGDRYDTDIRILTKRPITAGPNELVFNPRSRSAKLRAAIKIKTERGITNAYSGKK